MPTTENRADFIQQSIRYFQRQDYPRKELLVIHDGSESFPALFPRHASVRFIRVAPGFSIGAKRNLACVYSQGEIVLHWDDDDWYAPNRLRAQATPIISDQADITAITPTLFLELDTWTYWACSPNVHRNMFAYDVHASGRGNVCE